MIRVLLSDPQVLFREGVHFTLSGQEDFEVVGETTNNEDALALIEEAPPTVAILNARNGKLDGAAVTRRIKRNLPSVSVILFLDDEKEEQVFSGIKSGASACLSKDIDPDYLVDIIRRVVAGGHPVVEQLLTPGLALRVLAGFEDLFALGEQFSHLLVHLSLGETEVLRCIAAGSSLEQAAAKLSSDEDTVRRQLGMIVDKLVANDQSEAVVRALEKGLPSIFSSMIIGSGHEREYLTEKEFNTFKESLMRRLKPFLDGIALPEVERKKASGT